MFLATSNPSLSAQLAAAIPLALAACFYPPAIAVLLYYLSRESARRLVLAYVAGAFVMTFLVGVAGILVLSGANVNPRHHPSPSAGLDVALGVVMLVAAFLVARRRRPSARKEKEPKERRPGPRGAALLGVVMYLPSLFYLSALKLVADADPSVTAAVLCALLLTVCVLAFILVPVALFLLFPERTDARLRALDAWMRRHGRTLLVWGFTIGGLYMCGTGVYRFVTA